MRILLLNQYFDPEVAASSMRLTELARDLSVRHEVTALAGRSRFGHTSMGAPVDRLRVVRVPSTAFARRRLAGRLLNYLTYLVSVTLSAVLRRRADVVVAATDPPMMGFIGLIVSRLHRARFVHLLLDVQPHVAIQAGLLKRGVLADLVGRGSRSALRHADRVIVPTHGMARTAKSEGADADRISVIPLWEDTAVVVPMPKDNAFSRSHGLVDRFVVMYSGNLGLTQQLERFLALAARLRDLSDLVLAFVGDGASKAALEARARTDGLTTVRCFPYQPRETMSESLAAADVLFAPLAPGLTPYMFPSKAFTYLASGRPIVVAIDEASDIADVLRATGAALVGPPGDVDAVERHIRWLYARPADRELMGRRAREAAENCFSRVIVTKRYLDVLAALEGGRAP